MDEIKLNPGERLDELQLNGLRIIQREDMFRFGTDSVLLADFAAPRPGTRVADFGTGNGILPLLLSGRAERLTFDAFELQPEAAELARRNAELNGMTDSFHVYCDDLRNAVSYIGRGKTDLVICNPPYYKGYEGMQSTVESKRIARHEDDCSLEEIFSSAFAVLKCGGRLVLSFPAIRLTELLSTARAMRMEPKRLQLVHPKADREAYLALLECVREAKPQLRVLPPLVTCEEDGSMTPRMRQIYHIDREGDENS